MSQLEKEHSSSKPPSFGGSKSLWGSMCWIRTRWVQLPVSASTVWRWTVKKLRKSWALQKFKATPCYWDSKRLVVWGGWCVSFLFKQICWGCHGDGDDEWMNEWMNERTNEWTNERTNEWMNEWWMMNEPVPHETSRRNVYQQVPWFFILAKPDSHPTLSPPSDLSLRYCGLSRGMFENVALQAEPVELFSHFVC